MSERAFVAEVVAQPWAALEAGAKSVRLADGHLDRLLHDVLGWAEENEGNGIEVLLTEMPEVRDLETEATVIGVDMGTLVRRHREETYRRHLRSVCQRAASDVMRRDPREVASELARALDDKPPGELRVETFGESAEAWLRWSLTEEERGETGRGWTGLGCLDQRIKGLRAGSLWVLGGRSGCRKSSLVLCAAIKCLGTDTMPGIVSLEDGPSVMGDRIVRQFAAAADASPGLASRRTVADQVRRLQGMVAYAPDATEPEILDACRTLLARGARILFVDYVQAGRFNVNARRYDLAVAQAVRSIKALAARAQVPVVVASQLHESDTNPHKEPTTRDLKESRILLDVAEVVTLLWKSEKGEDSPVCGRLAKLKWGPEGMPFVLRINEDHGVVVGADEGHPAAASQLYEVR